METNLDRSSFCSSVCFLQIFQLVWVQVGQEKGCNFKNILPSLSRSCKQIAAHCRGRGKEVDYRKFQEKTPTLLNTL